MIYFSIDDEINPEIPRILQEYENLVSTKNNANVYRLGMWIESTKPPYEAGLEIIESYNRAILESEGKVQDLDLYNYPEEGMKLDEEEQLHSPLMCNFEASDCINFIWATSGIRDKFTSQYGEYITRLNELIEYSKFNLFLSPSYMVPEIQASEDLFALKLKLLEIIAMYRSENDEESLNEISKLLIYFNSELECTPYPMPKVVALVSNIIITDVISFLISKTNVNELEKWMHIIELIPPLTHSQLSMEKVLLQEFVIFTKAEKDIHEGNIESLPWYIKFAPKSLIYKPNLTSNLFLKEIMKGINTVSIENGKLKIKRSHESEELAERIQLRNLLGSTLVLTAIPKYINVERDLYLLDLKRYLLREVYEIKLTGEQVSESNLPSFLNPLSNESIYLKDDERLCLPDSKGKDICIFI